MTSPTSESKGGKVVVLLTLGLMILVGAAYAGAWWTAKDRVPRGTTVSGVEVGGMTDSEAREALVDGLAEAESRTIEVTVEGTEKTLSPMEAGLSVDHDASVEQVSGRDSWRPSWLWDYFTGGDDVDAVVAVDEQKLRSSLTSLTDSKDEQPVDGSVGFKNGEVVVEQAQTGVGLDPEGSADALSAAYLSDEPVELPVEKLQPDIDASDVGTAVDEFANPAMSGPVRLRFGDTTVRLAPDEFGAALSMVPKDGVLVPQVNRKKLFGLVDQSISGNGAPVDATVRLVGGTPQVVPGKPGVTYAPDALARAFLSVVAKADDREAEVKAKTAKPEFTTKDARALGIKEQVSTFSTYYPHADYRNVNLGRAAELIDGTVLKPGDTFSLNGIVGERTAENGFTEGYVISDGILVSDLGGGVSQMATTLFNAMFFAGLEDVEHKPHSFYISRYPKGREATVAWGALDLAFRNDTPYGVLVSAQVTPSTYASSGEVTVTMYSTKYWNITTKTGGEYNHTDPQVRRVDSQTCHDNEGYGGFDVDVWRYFEPVGANDGDSRTEKFHTTYTPSDTVICTHPNAEDNVS